MKWEVIEVAPTAAGITHQVVAQFLFRHHAESYQHTMMDSFSPDWQYHIREII